ATGSAGPCCVSGCGTRPAGAGRTLLHEHALGGRSVARRPWSTGAGRARLVRGATVPAPLPTRGTRRRFRLSGGRTPRRARLRRGTPRRRGPSPRELAARRARALRRREATLGSVPPSADVPRRTGA